MTAPRTRSRPVALVSLASLLLVALAGCNALLGNGYPPDGDGDVTIDAGTDAATAKPDTGPLAMDAGDGSSADSGTIVLASVEAPEHIAVNQGIVFWTSDSSLGRIEADGTVLAKPTFLAGTGPYPLALGGGSTVYVGGAFNGFLQVVVCTIDLATCTSFRAFGGHTTATGIVANAASAYVATQSALLAVLANGTTAWTSLAAASAIADDQGRIYVTDVPQRDVPIHDEANGVILGLSPKVGGALLAIDLGGGTLAMTTLDGGVYTCATTAMPDGGVTLIAAASNPVAVRVDATHVYWVEDSAADGGTVRRCPLAGCSAGGPEILASGQKHPRDLVLEGAFVYWANKGDGTPGTGAIMKRPK